jgi:signal transduction histidine kinase
MRMTGRFIRECASKMFAGVGRLSLLWKILLSTSIAITILLALTGWFVQDQVFRSMSDNLQNEIQGSFRAYESLWQARAGTLRSVSLVLSNMSDVRAAFSTNDRLTIRDTAGEIWSKISPTTGLFLVTDPQGNVIASLGGGQDLGNRLPAVREAAHNFPEQTTGFVWQKGRLYQMVITPVYVENGLIDVLAAGYLVDGRVAAELKAQTGESDFVFLANGKPVASTLDAGATAQVVAGRNRYAVIGSPLLDMHGAPVGEILIVKSFDAARRRMATLQNNLILTWLAAILAGLIGSYLLARRILEPVKELDRAAAMIARQEYETLVPHAGNDELGRLANSFNVMSRSIRSAREELIRQERIATIGRLATSIVHDLRNPLAAIYGGAEMMMDGQLNESQLKRLAANIYRSSRAIKDLLQELVDVSRRRTPPAEICHLRDVVGAAAEVQAANAEACGVEVSIDVRDDLEAPMDRARMERVFQNLIGNAVEVMPNGGRVTITAEPMGEAVLIRVEDTGPGIPDDVRTRLFEPFTTSGKKNGLGLGLALSRQTVLDHGGDLWADEEMQNGARFWVRIPRNGVL